MRTHMGTSERADALTKRDTQLRFDLMQLQSPGWFNTALAKYCIGKIGNLNEKSSLYYNKFTDIDYR